MTTLPLLERSLGALALDLPGATAVFHAHGLDFCCGGRQVLGEALAARALPVAPILQALERLVAHPTEDALDWRQASVPAVIHHLLERFHQVHRRQLPELVRLARRVESVHGGHPECPHGLADHLAQMAQALEAHMQKEEQILFPLLIQGASPAALPPVWVMREEHLQHGRELERMMELAHQLRMPAGACTSWRALLSGLAVLRNDLMEHIHLENNLLFEAQPAA